jgi:hypothetical protein
MEAFLAYLLGLLTILVIFLPLYLLAKNSKTVSTVYSNALCNNLA